MLALALILQLLAPADTDSVYATPALRALVARAANANADVPPRLAGYRARVETELSFVIRDTLGREHTTQIEQLASTAAWSRERYDLHVLGFRSQSLGVPFSALSFVQGWTVPMLYGNELRLGIEGPRDAAGVLGRTRRGRRDTMVVVAPFAAERDLYYRFRGGDVVAVLHTPARAVPVARILVTPATPPDARRVLFRGEIDVDVERGEVVRMRGRYVYPDAATEGGWRGLTARAAGIVSAAYVEFVNEEVAGRFWLPAYQRTEFVAGASMLGPERSLFRLVSTFTGYAIDTSAVALALPARMAAPRVTYASSDTLNAFAAWREPLGTESTRVSGGDFDDLAPDAWQARGGATLRPYPRRLGDVLRYDRVEGAFTGVAGDLRFRDAVPGLVARASAGWAWSERTVRGGGSIEWTRGTWTFRGRAERVLASTNDFRPALEGGASVGALLASIDDEDYVDRRIAAVGVTRGGGGDRFVSDAEVGLGEDSPEEARLSHGLFSSKPFRSNRYAMPGRYLRAAGDMEYQPGVSGDFLQPGLGGRLHIESVAGQLHWTRAELTVSARRYWNDAWLAARSNGGIVVGRAMPPQSLFELGGIEGLPGYEYKEFGGDRAAVARLATGYTFPVLRAPRRLIRRYRIPGISPGVAAGVQGGWAEASGAAARRALSLLGGASDSLLAPLSTPTGRIRATVDVRLTVFSGAASIGIVRPVDHAAPWRLLVALGQAY